MRKKNNSKKASILIIITAFYPGYKSGGPNQSIQNLVLRLKDKASFKILTLNRDVLSDIPYKNIEPNTWTKYFDIPIMYLHYCH